MYTLENKSHPKVTVGSGKMLFNSLSAATLQQPAKPEPRRIRAFPQILVLADDLTGACDSASAFVRHGHSARVWLTEHSTSPTPESVWVRHTASRDISSGDAAQKVALAADSLPASPDTLLFKKVDSAGRGNIAAELLAARDAYAADLILLAPSFPATGRVVRNGILQVRDIAGQSKNLHLATLFPDAHHSHIGCASTPADLLKAFANQKKIILCDAETDADLKAIAQTASALPARILWAGSGGLANALAAFHKSKQPVESPSSPPRAGSILVIAGTPHQVTQLQLKHLLNAPQTVPLSVSDGHLDIGACGVLQITCGENDPAGILRLWQQLRPRPRALVLTGGDTAALALNALAAEAIILKGDISPGVPWGIVEGGLADRCIVVTKSGGFGNEASLTNAVSFLREQHA